MTQPIFKTSAGWIAPRLKHYDKSKVRGLLVQLGMHDSRSKQKQMGRPCHLDNCPRRRNVGKGNIWALPECEILEILANARTLYRARRKQLHPDSLGITSQAHKEAATQEFVRVTALWARIQKIFAAHGYTLLDDEPRPAQHRHD